MNSKQNSTPQNRFFSRLSYQQKFILVTLVFILAFSGFIPLVSELFTRIQQYGYMELNGTRYLVPVQTLLVDIQIHQLTLHEFLDGDVPYSEVEVVQTRINDDLRALAEMQVQYGTELQVQNDYQIIQEKWNTLYTDARTLSDDESSALHQELAQLIQNLITHVGNTSFLILDPELDTYYLMDTVVLKQPQVQEQLNNLASSGALFIHAEVISENEKLLLLNLTSQLVSLNENMQKNLEIGLTYNTSGQMRTWVEAPLATAISANEAVISEIQSQLERETTTSEFEQNLHATIRAAQDANMELYRATSQALEQGIQGRITRYATRLATAASIALIAIFLAIVIGVGLMRAISRPLQNLVEAANRLAQGEYSARVPITSLDEAGKVAQTFNLMAQEVEASRTQLETRVAVRTRDLELAAEVGRNLTSIRDLNALLQEAVDTIRNRFELYYAQVYLTDTSGFNLVLRAGTGQVGAQLVGRGHTLSVGPGSINGTAAANLTPVVVPDTTKNLSFLPNALLPETRSEAAIPLLVNRRLVGVLNLQASVPNALTEDNLTGFEAVAGQLAIAIENAALFQETSLARAEMESQFAQQSQAGWAAFFDGTSQKDQVGYTFQGNELRPLTTWDPSPETNAVIQKPITIQDENFGEIQLAFESPNGLSQAEKVVDAIIQQIAQQIDSLRLISQAQAYQAEAQNAVRRLTRESWQEYLDTLGYQGRGFLYDQQEIKPLVQKPHVNGSSIERPILLHGTPVGELVVDGVDGSNEDVQTLTESVSQLLSTQLENIRLFEEVERRGLQLETRSKELEASQRVTFAASEVTKLEDLFHQVVNLIRDQFDLYHVQIYMVNETQDDAILRESTGYAGAQLLQRGHHIPLQNTSLVTKAIRTSEPVLVADVNVEESFLANALLPYTQAELVLPLKVGTRTLGALDLQSRRTEQFTPETIALFRQVADQISLIIERTNTQVELEKLLALQKATFDSTADGILAVDLAGNILTFNRKFVEMWNIPQEVIDAHDDARALGAVIESLKDPEAFIARVQELYANPSEVAENELIRLKDGRMFERFTMPQQGEDGQIVGRVWSFRDITERENAAKALRDSLAVRDTLYAGSSRIVRAKTMQEVLLGLVGSTFLQTLDRISILLFDQPWNDVRPAGMVVAALWESNPEANTAPIGTRYRLDQMPFVNFVDREKPTVIEDIETSDLIDPFTKAAFQKIGTNSMQIIPLRVAGDWIGVINAQSKMKTAIPEESIRQVVSLVDQAAAVIQSHRLYDGTLKRALELETVAQLGAIATMQTKPEELIHTMAVQTVKRFNLFHADVYLLNEDTKVLALAASAGEGEQWMTQIPFDEQDCLVAQVAQTRQGIICNDLTHGARFLSQLIETGAQSGLAVPLMTGDRLLGVLAVYSSLANVFKEDDIRIKSVLAAQLVAAYENARLFTEIQEAAQRLKELDKLKSEFLANMSHELRTPLNSVIGYSEVLLMGLDGELSSEAQTDIQAIYDNGRHLLSLINDVLDLAKIEAGRIVLHKKPESVITLFEQAKTNNMGLLHKLKKPIEIKTEIAPNLPTVHVDPTRIVQVIGNLISNAIKYSDKGTVTLRGYPVEEWVNIEVEDQGIGIAPEDLGKVFDQFTQLDMSSTRKVEGTGLGLSITRHLVEMHGGTITVESELGIGSKFIVRLPTTETNGYHKN